MEGYGPSTWGDFAADGYDEMFGERTDTSATVDFLAALAGRGPVLELGVGTGRIAVPLAERGVEVHGIDASRAMVTRLQAKSAGRRVVAVVADFARPPLAGSYSLVFIVYNTLFNLTTQDDQVSCFTGVARMLEPGGKFVVEAFVPDTSRWAHGQSLVVGDVSIDGFVLHVSRHDPLEQRFDGHDARIAADGVRLLPISARYVFVPELDLMARCAGLELSERWASWTRQPFTAASTSHVSVYEKP